jgi:sialate O-acetylesterase
VKRALKLFTLSLLCAPLEAEVTLPPIFGDHMVLQQGATLPVWGDASPGENIQVRYAGRFGETTADACGKWRVTLRPLPVSSEPGTLIIRGSNRIEIRDVLVGDVWVCAGGSNMEFPLSRTEGSLPPAGKIADPELRFYTAVRTKAPGSEPSGSGRWVVCSAETAASFSAVGYHFARDIRATQRIPVGMICCAQGGLTLSSWISPKGLAREPSFSRLLAEARTGRLLPESSARPKIAQQEASPGDSAIPCSAYKTMIAPLAPYAICGVLWYEGEADEGLRALEYRRLFPRLIRDWRQAWGQGPFPFYFVSLAGFGNHGGGSVEPFLNAEGAPGPAWPWIREAQAGALRLPMTGMAVASDLGNAGDPAPSDKLDVGRRLALIARHHFYGEDLLDSGPILRSMKLSGHRVVLDFDSTGSGLTVGVSPARMGEGTPSISPSLQGFAIAGSDRKWRPATATIRGSQVLLESDAVPAPEAARYNWNGLTEGNLYNREGLPAAPFRTDADQPDRGR